MIGAGPVTMKSFVLVAVPAGVRTVIGPFVAPKGTVTRICVGAVTENAAVRLLKLTFVVPMKLRPLTVTTVFVALLGGKKSAITGATTKLLLLDPVPDGLMTRMGPVEASKGTTAIMRLSAVALKSATASLNRTSEAVEKPEPLRVTWVPGRPWAGEKLLIAGAATTAAVSGQSWSDQTSNPIRRILFTRLT